MTFYKTTISILLSFILCFSSVFAQTSYGDIQLLIKQEQYKEALKLTEIQLSRNKSDIKLQFMKGLILTRLDRYSDAEKIFIQLTIENPELPEPFNNLAVVYAAQGKYPDAEAALKGAINTHPSYATSHENLGDIYAKMASRAYNQALELDTSSKTTREKLSLVNELISAPPVPEIEKSVVAMATPEPKMEAKPEQEKKQEVKPVQEPEIITIPAKQKTEPVKAEEKPVLPPVKKVDGEGEIAQNRKAVELAVNNWANAWSAQDVGTYLLNYAQEFIPPKRLSRAAWEKERRTRLLRPSFIKVTLSNMKINLHGKDYAEVKFTQKYQSDTYGDKVNKEILMRKVEDKWLITQERTR
ncbi:MAG: tetratricopeptide repeat protein [Proteobacteria bacterium]|nr:tetratricopeptide repeat protein [Pseudomonadota bacterium]